MKAFLPLTLVLLCLQAHADTSEKVRAALESQTRCSRLVQFDDSNLYLGLPNQLKIISLEDLSEQLLNLPQSPMGITSFQNQFFILTPNVIQAWDASSLTETFTTETYALGRTKAYQEHAQGWAQYKDKLIIAHGRLGLSFFDLNKKRITNQFRLLRDQAPLESMAMGVTVQGRFAYVVMDNFSLTRPPAKTAFRGIIIVDMESEKVVAQIPGLDPGATHVMSDKKGLIVSYGGSTYWKFDLQPNGMVALDPSAIRPKFPYRGHPTGTSSMDSKYIFSCYLKAPEYQGENGGLYKNIPVVMEREKLGKF